eukprot:3293685-Amphidinium_carterae.3
MAAETFRAEHAPNICNDKCVLFLSSHCMHIEHKEGSQTCQSRIHTLVPYGFATCLLGLQCIALSCLHERTNPRVGAEFNYMRLCCPRQEVS